MSHVRPKKSRNSSKTKSNQTRLMTTVRSSARKASAEKDFSNYPEREKRQYEHIKQGYLKIGKNKKKAKTIAAATVNKTRSLRGHKKNKSM